MLREEKGNDVPSLDDVLKTGTRLQTQIARKMKDLAQADDAELIAVNDRFQAGLTAIRGVHTRELATRYNLALREDGQETFTLPANTSFRNLFSDCNSCSKVHRMMPAVFHGELYSLAAIDATYSEPKTFTIDPVIEAIGPQPLGETPNLPAGVSLPHPLIAAAATALLYTYTGKDPFNGAMMVRTSENGKVLIFTEKHGIDLIPEDDDTIVWCMGEIEQQK